MSSERVTISIQSSLGEDGPLTVSDALHQVIDIFDLLNISQEALDTTGIKWRLVSISKNSPLTATAEAFSTVAGVSVDLVAKQAKLAVSSAILDITNGRSIPAWMNAGALQKAKAILTRNTNAIGLTRIVFEDAPLSPAVIIGEKFARIGLMTLQNASAGNVNAQDLSRHEFGSVEGVIFAGCSYHGRPALKITERLTGEEVTCVLSDDLQSEIGKKRPLEDAWSGRRVQVSGEIVYRKDGTPQRVHADAIRDISAKQILIADFADPDFTKGLTPPDYLAEVWDADDE